MDFTLERNVISDAELADLLSDCTDGSCPTSPDHDEEFAYDQLDIPFALPVKNEAMPDTHHLDFHPPADGINGGASMPLFGADDGTGGPEFVKRPKREACSTPAKSSNSASKPAPVDTSTGTSAEAAAKAAAAFAATATVAAAAAERTPAAANSTGAAVIAISNTDVAAADVDATPAAEEDLETSGGQQRGVKRGASADASNGGGGQTVPNKYPDLNEPGISAEELKRRRRETRLMKNRESANRSRLRRKKNLESLEVENGRLHTELRGARCQISALRELCGLMQRTLSSHNIPIVLPAELQAQLAPAPVPIAECAPTVQNEPAAPAPVLVSPPTSPMSTDTYFDEDTTLFRNAPMSEHELARTAALQQRARARAGLRQGAPQDVSAVAPKSGPNSALQVVMFVFALCAAAWWAAGTESVPMGFLSRVTEAVVANVLTVVLSLLTAVAIGRKALSDAAA